MSKQLEIKGAFFYIGSSRTPYIVASPIDLASQINRLSSVPGVVFLRGGFQRVALYSASNILKIRQAKIENDPYRLRPAVFVCNKAMRVIWTVAKVENAGSPFDGKGWS